MNYWQARYQKRKEEGFCVKCGKSPPVSNELKCQPCKDKIHSRKDYYTRRYAERKQENLCVDCGKLSRVDKVFCQSCWEHRNRYRYVVVEHYGGSCTCCGENIAQFLELDHTDNDGAKHRKEVGVGTGHTFYRWIVDNNYPNNFQLLCSNCNKAKYANGGLCPHQTKVKELFLHQLKGLGDDQPL